MNTKKLEKIKYCAFDLDGTLLDSKGRFFLGINEGLETLNKKYIKNFIVTGRPLDSFLTLDISKSKNVFEKVIVCHDGNLIYNTEDNTSLILKTIDKLFFDKLFFEYENFCEFVINIEGATYAESKSAALKYSMIHQVDRKLINIAKVSDLDLSKIIEIHLFPRKKEKLNLPKSQYVYTNLRYLNAVRITTSSNKSNGFMKALSIHCNKNSFENTMAFGDGINDISLIENCEIGFSVKESHDDLISVSDFHIKEDLGKFLVNNFS